MGKAQKEGFLPLDIMVSKALMHEATRAWAGLLAAWSAAGSAGLMAHPLRRGIVVLCLLIGTLAGRNFQIPRPKKAIPTLLLTGCVAACLASPFDYINIIGCGLALAYLGTETQSGSPSLLTLCARAVCLFGFYRFALFAVPWFWFPADFVARKLSQLASAMTGQPLESGPTFAGLDYMVLGLAVVWNVASLAGKRRIQVTIVWLLAMCLVHLLYLSLIAYFPQWSRFLPQLTVKPSFPGSPPGSKPLGEVILWNLPLAALFFHGMLTLVALRYITRSSYITANECEIRKPGERNVSPTSVKHSRPGLSTSLVQIQGRILRGVVWLLCAAVPLVALLQPTPLSLEGRKIVFYEKGFLNWLKPRHGEYGRLSVGMYGMLPAFCESYGAKCVVSPDLSESDLSGADLLVLIFPNRPWEKEQLFRIWKFVRDGGSLLVLGEHTVREKDGGSRFNEVLEPTAMRVAFDSAMFAVGGWLNSYNAVAHPASLGIRDDRNQFGVVIGASVQARWPASPLLFGRYGWADPGDVSNDESRGGSMMGNQKYDGGERLGDLLLAAEQRLGRG
ncbi:MAG: GldG family protein, partial [Verrucomicrobiae bacterium]|nr:GldG family protein [Verrucomicrobiae bacterium]